MAGWRALVAAMVAGCCAASAAQQGADFGVAQGTASGIVTIQERGQHIAEISVDGVFAGYTPIVLKLPSATSDVVVTVSEEQATHYIFRMVGESSGVRLVSANVDTPVRLDRRICDPINQRDRAGAISWARTLGERERHMTWLHVPGPVRGGHCQAAPPSFGSGHFRDLLITSTPAGAIVTFEGRRLGVTPVQARIMVQAEPVRISASMNGYLTAAATVRGDQVVDGRPLRFMMREAR